MALKKSDQRALIILGAVVLVAVLAWFLFLRGGGGDETAAGGAAGTSPGVPVSPGVSPGISPAVTPPPPPNDFVIGGRDPFSPLPTPTPSASPSPGGSETTQPSSKEVGGKTVSLEDVVDDAGTVYVNVKVDEKLYRHVKSSEEFANFYRVTSIVGSCATFKYEKDADKQSFELCVAS